MAKLFDTVAAKCSSGRMSLQSDSDKTERTYLCHLRIGWHDRSAWQGVDGIFINFVQMRIARHIHENVEFGK